jgi:hypothetical protein
MANTLVPTERGRLITRYSLTTTPMYLQVHQYLAPLSLPQSPRRGDEEAHATFDRLLELASKTVDDDSEISSALARIAALLLRPIKDVYLDAFDQLRWSPYDDLARTFVCVVYARALHHLQHTPRDPGEFVANVRRLLVESRPAMGQRLATLEALAPDFVGHLVAEAEARRGENPFFRERLERAGELFDRHRGDEPSWVGAPPKAHPLAVIAADHRASRVVLPACMAFVMTVHE